MSIIYENNDLLKVESRSVIPDYVMSFSEAALYVAESINADYNSLMESIGVEELAVFESTGMEIVYEGERLNSFKEKVVNFFKQAWSTIKGFFEKILGWFESKRKESMRNLKSKIDKADLSKIPDGTVFGKMHKMGEKDITDEATKFCVNTNKFLRKVNEEFGKVCKDVDEASEESKSKAKDEGSKLKEELVDNLVKEISGYDVKTVADAKKKIEESLVGEEEEINKGNIEKKLLNLNMVVINGKVNDSIKVQYKNMKKAIDDAITRTKGYTDARVICAGKEIDVYSKVMQCTLSVIGKTMDVYKRYFSESRNIFVKVAVKAGKIKATNESVEQKSVVESQISLVESILNF